MPYRLRRFLCFLALLILLSPHLIYFPCVLRFCPRCTDFKCALKKMQFWSSPGLLCFHLKRFSMDENSYWTEKQDTPVQFPLEGLDMRPYVLNPGEITTYSLAAVSNHFGGLGGGHYTAHARNSTTGKWYDFDDTQVTEIDVSAIDFQAAYVLIYIRDDFRPQSWTRVPSPSDPPTPTPPPADGSGSGGGGAPPDPPFEDPHDKQD